MTAAPLKKVFVSYKRNVEPDAPMAERIVAGLAQAGCDVFIDRQMQVGVEWAKEIVRQIRQSDFFVVLLTKASLEADGVLGEIEEAWKCSRETSRPVILPVRLSFLDDLEYPLNSKLGKKQHAFWQGEEGTPALIQALVRATQGKGHGRQRYLKKLVEDVEAKARLYSPLHGIAQTKPQHKANSRMLQPWKDDPDIALLRYNSRNRDQCEAKTEQRDYNDILSAFGEVRRAALLGAPGSGKSTTLRKLAVERAKRALEDPEAPAPLLAPLGNWTGGEPLSEFLAGIAPEIGGAERLVLLLDGLNEMPTATRADKARQVKELQCSDIIVSCRREDYTGDLDLGLDTLAIEPLSPQRIRAAVTQWVTDGGEPAETADRFFWQLAGDAQLAGVFEKWTSAGASEDAFWSVSDPKEEKNAFAQTTGEEDELWRRHIPNPRSLLRLASNPFMLTMLFQVWVAEEGVLPQNRGDLFGRFINRLLSREGLLARDPASGEWRFKPDGERLLAGLGKLAWKMQRERVEDSGVLTAVSRGVAVEALGDVALLKKALDGTLLEGNGDVRFRHQLLQEYFTAQALEGRMGQMQAAELWPAERWWERTGWEETAVLLAGFQAGDCTGVIRWLAAAQPEVAAQCILESGAKIANKPGLLAELQAAWLPRMVGPGRESAPEGRAAIGRALGRLGLDSRRGVGLRADGLPDIDWVEIPGGKFVYQEGERRQLQRFRMARYPVTNAQFQAFLDAEDGYLLDRWWKGLSDPDRRPERPEWSEPNHPRTRVSWYEAMAFCAWLSDKLQMDVRLPTEWQWERAARGKDGRVYPWGNEYVPGYANIDETERSGGSHYLQSTSAVGLYPEGASPEGVLDLSGNVWEWCLNEYAKPERTQVGGEESRVLRGGCWVNDLDLARAGFRGHNVPDYRNYYFGFRVVCWSPIAGR